MKSFNYITIGKYYIMAISILDLKILRFTYKYKFEYLSSFESHVIHMVL